MPNRFEQVDEVVPDAITVVLEQTAMGQWANILVPHAAAPMIGEDWKSEKLAPKDALSNAVKFANKLKVAIVIYDPDAIWKPEWGDLYREADDDAGAENT